MLFRLMLMVGAVCYLATNVFAVDGFAVSIAGGTGTLQHYGAINGKVMRYNIENDEVTGTVELASDKKYSRPVISPDGNNVAFVRDDGKICMVPSGGGSIVELCDAHENSQIDFPVNDYVYFTMGSFHEHPESGELKKVNISSKAVEDIGTVKNDGCSGDAGLAQFHVANDGKSAVVRSDDDNSNTDPYGRIMPLDLSASQICLDESKITGGGWHCAAGVSSDGNYIIDGWQGHDGFDIKKYDSPSSKETDFRNSDALNWSPGGGSVNDNHAIFNSGGATNHPHWMCIVVGSDAHDAREAQILINWNDQKCINVTSGRSSDVDHGDFWVGDLSSVSHDYFMNREFRPAVQIGPNGIRVNDDAAASISISNVLGRTVGYHRNVTGTLKWNEAFSGLHSASAGVYLLKIHGDNGASSETIRFNYINEK